MEKGSTNYKTTLKLGLGAGGAGGAESEQLRDDDESGRQPPGTRAPTIARRRGANQNYHLFGSVAKVVFMLV